MDGVTTNGILLMHLDGERFDTNAKSTKWKEVSVGGSVFDLGEGRLKFNYQSAVNDFLFYFCLMMIEFVRFYSFSHRQRPTTFFVMAV